MSLILDALKKLERERSAGSAGRRDITAEILKAGDPPHRSGLLPLMIALGVTASVAAFVTFLVIGGSGPRTGEEPPTSPAAPARQTASAPYPTVPAAVANKPAPTSPDADSLARQQPGAAKGNGETAAGGRIPGRDETPGKLSARPEAGTASRPAVKISGIVWQEEPSERKAMINGKVARVGDTVDGMRILEIHPSHVKLSFDGKSFKAGMFE